MPAGVMVIGFDRLLKKLDPDGKLKDVRITLIHDTAGFAQAAAKGKAPTRTGTLASSIGAQVADYSARVGTSLYYARFQEFGTHTHAGGWHVTPRKFMAKARTATRNELKRLIGIAITALQVSFDAA